MINEALRRALELEKATLEARRRELEQQIASLEADKEAVSFRLVHVNALIREPDIEAAGEDEQANVERFESSGDVSDPLEIAYSILEERGAEPIYYRELAELVRQKGGELEGADPAMTLVSRLVTDDRFIRPFRRGWYALRAHYPKGRSVGRRKKRNSKRYRPRTGR
jgi:hypothetical protein